MSTKNDFWIKKINAIMYTPIEKVFINTDHEELQKNRLKRINIEYIKSKSESLANTADKVLLPNKNEIKVDFNNDELLYIHPLSGNKLKNEYKEFVKNINDKKEWEIYLNDLSKMNLKSNELYHKLWWDLPNVLKYSYMYPADTKIPDNSIIDHLDTTAAMSNSENISILMLSIGPVQEFIAAGRKIIDLKTGSYLLSYLTYKGIKYIGENYGYDSIIFPSMRENYFLSKDHNFELSKEVDPSIASLPNVFTAILPTNDIEKIVKEVENEIKNEMKKISNYIKENIIKFGYNEKKREMNEKIKLKNWNELWDKQVEQFPVIIAVHQDISSSNIIDEHVDYTNENIAKEVENAFKNVINTKEINKTTFFGFASELIGIKSAIRKATRNFIQLKEEFEETGDDISANNKALVYYKFIDEDKNIKTEKLSALSTIKRYFYRYLEEKTIYKNASRKIRKVESIEEITKEYNMAILMMDGDKMGEWISGRKEEIPNFLDRMHPKVQKELEKIDKNYYEFLKNTKYVIPSYQRTVSRTLNNFTKFVSKIVSKYNGYLIYAGGDDVLAIFPSNTVLQAANDLRKVYSGSSLNEKITIKNKEYTFKDGWAFENGIPVYNMMGENATMSAGILIANPKYNLKLALDEARKLEKIAKNNGRNSFALGSVRGTGKFSYTVSKWEDKKDILKRVINFFETYSKEENKRSIKRLSSKLKNEYISLSKDKDIQVLSTEEYINYVVPFALKKRMELKDTTIKNIKEILNDFNELIKKEGGNFIEILNIFDEVEHALKKRDKRGEKN
ncbi:type III-B CRISPR-associated protein Cas10/Cmr2 [Tepiditoga spiralis]|uniref:Type III-B CRISPR-associated protein Cas10/Cmr2 n=1 Tax=Tepiditoga spiralis TaxID=2108365 RepID=A0A7G1G927_9BACT|nr:type III-B CRISPR-associated protein Cas10/Cmr2 [Tepiditoga spiralis]BBE31754.1 type III-B CRISPR-associated protein Cas10/Cmr2 [Tepiditoga spiralis]